MASTRDIDAAHATIDVARSDKAAIADATRELIRGVLAREEIDPDAIVSCVFIVSTGLDAMFPAAAAREMGLDRVALLDVTSAASASRLPERIEVLLHFRRDSA